MRTPILLSTILALAACDAGSDDSASTAARGDCNPIQGDQHCLLPFPSSYFLAEDDTSPTGFRVAFGPESLPINESDIRTDPTYWNERDGFSTLGPLLAFFPDLSTDGLPRHDDLGATLDEDVATVIVDAETGERVPHWCELDDRAEDPTRRALVIRPAVPMEHGRRYVVGLRGLRDSAGAAIEAPAAFATLRDGGSTDDPDLERLRDGYERIVFPTLETAGFARDELTLAWDFKTASRDADQAKMLLIRDDALSRVPAGGPPYTVTAVVEGDCAAGDSIGRTVKGTFTAPVYLTSWEAGSFLTRGDDGMPFYNGDAEIPFTIRVPCTLRTEPRPGRLVQFGHGLFGNQSEVQTGHLSDMAQRYGWILFAVDWTGMKSEDVATVFGLMGSGLTEFATVPERTQQGWVEQVLAGRMMLGDMANDENLVVDGQSLVDTSALHFYGISQGAILGGGYVAISPDIERAALGVGGTPYALLLPRSYDFEAYMIILRAVYPDPVDIAALIALMQMLWDPGETAGWARYVSELPVDATTPNKQVLCQTAIGDAEVSTLGGQVAARAFGAALVDPPVREVWGLETRAAPFEGSALVEFDFGVEEPFEQVPPDEETDTHHGPRYETVAQEQIRAFFEEGVVTQPCDGACDPN